jgi:cell division protein FtsW
MPGKNRERKKPDMILFWTCAALVVFGLLTLASVSPSLSQEKYGNTYYYFLHQILYGVIPGIIIGFFLYRTDINKIKKWSPLALGICLVLLAMVMIPAFGVTAGGATRWLKIGPLPSIQPSEFLKLTFVLYLAAILSARTEFNEVKSLGRKTKNFWQPLIIFSVIMAIVGILLYKQPDMTTLGIIAAVAGIMYFLANTPILHTAILGGLGMLLLVFLATCESYRLDRIKVFFNQQLDPMGIGYQINQALIAVGSGGLLGLGLGLSRQQFGGFLPASMSDSIFAVIAEETGFVGSFILIFLFVTFMWRGFKIGKRSLDGFSKLTAFGITSWIAIQTFINIASMINMFPLAGIPLPFFSYGGTAIITELAAVGILLNISRKTSG